MLKTILTFIAIIAIFAGCSSKQYFEPEDTVGYYNAKQYSLSEDIKYINKDGATLSDLKIISKNGISNTSLPKGYRFLNISDNIILSANQSAQLLINKKVIQFKSNIVAATLKENLLALVYANNTLAIYDTTTEKFKYKEYQKTSAVNNTKIANPVFLDDIILFPTLDGNIVITSIKSYKLIKNINIDPNNEVNNIIFLKTIGDTMIAATSNKILSLGDGSFSIKDYNIKDIITNEQDIFIATLEGEVIKLDLSLAKIVSKKFKFSNIFALGFGTSLYALESQGYLIKLNENLTKATIYDFGFNEDEKTIIIGDTLYFEDSYIKLN